ncbi:MAG: serine hydrolase domain-containing protein [Gemmatimonadaceae bacterium]
MNIDRYVTAFNDPRRPGAAVVVARANETLIRAGFGAADLEAGAPVTPRTNFRLASLSKAFTSAAVLVLLRRGGFLLETPLTDALPSFPSYGRTIRIHHLLTHTSGLLDYEDFVPDDLPHQVTDADVLELMRTKTNATYFAPGHAFRYSNTAFALLALIVARYSGQSYGTFLDQAVFQPAGLQDTVAHEARFTTVNHRAYGYTVTRLGIQRTDQNPTSAVLGDGGIYSSIDDMLRWVRALEHHAVLTPDEWDRATTNASLANGTPSGVGYGWFIDVHHGHRRLRHHGETVGFTNAIAIYPDDALSIVVLTNRSDAAPWIIRDRIAEDVFADDR